MLRDLRVLSALVWEPGELLPLCTHVLCVPSLLESLLLSPGTMILTNLTALHRDPSEWATPDTFNPEHFLENGQFKKSESFMPFSIGE